MRRLIQKSMVSPKVIKFLMGGIVAAAVNFVLMAYLVEKLGFDTPILRNFANIIAIEAGLIVSFFIYRTWIWQGGQLSLRKIFFQQLPLYHLAGGAALVARSFIIFPLLDRLAVNYIVNTFIGMLIGTMINYLISNYIVFKKTSKY